MTNRVMGLLQAVGGIFMMLSGYGVAAGGTILSIGVGAPVAIPVGGGIMALGLDQLITGLRSMLDGQPHTSATGQAIDAIFGGGGQTADMVIGLGGGGVAIVQRGVLTIRSPRSGEGAWTFVRRFFWSGARGTPRTASYDTLRSELKETGLQAHHLNQDAVYGSIIPKSEGVCVGLRGNAIFGVGTPHYIAHRSLEAFWNQFRTGGARFGQRPTNAEYGRALEDSLVAAGLSRSEAAELAAEAARQRAAYGILPDALVPRIPNPISQMQP